MYINERQNFFNYEIIGEINLSVLEYDNSGMLSISGDMNKFFYESFLDRFNNRIPSIIPKKHAFKLNLTSTSAHNSTKYSHIVLVDKIENFTVLRNRSSEVYNIDLSFKYIKLTLDGISADDIYILEPVVSHIFSYGDFLAVVFEGDERAIQNTARKKFAQFCHGGVIYYSYDMKVCNAIMSDEPTITTVPTRTISVVCASNIKVPSEEGIAEFNDSLRYFLKSVYNFIELN